MEDDNYNNIKFPFTIRNDNENIDTSDDEHEYYNKKVKSRTEFLVQTTMKYFCMLKTRFEFRNNKDDFIFDTEKFIENEKESLRNIFKFGKNSELLFQPQQFTINKDEHKDLPMSDKTYEILDNLENFLERRNIKLWIYNNKDDELDMKDNSYKLQHFKDKDKLIYKHFFIFFTSYCYSREDYFYSTKTPRYKMSDKDFIDSLDKIMSRFLKNKDNSKIGEYENGNQYFEEDDDDFGKIFNQKLIRKFYSRKVMKKNNKYDSDDSDDSESDLDEVYHKLNDINVISKWINDEKFSTSNREYAAHSLYEKYKSFIFKRKTYKQMYEYSSTRLAIKFLDRVYGDDKKIIHLNEKFKQLFKDFEELLKNVNVELNILNIRYEDDKAKANIVKASNLEYLENYSVVFLTRRDYYEPLQKCFNGKECYCQWSFMFD